LKHLDVLLAGKSAAISVTLCLSHTREVKKEPLVRAARR
jgi:hypothetical protein